MSDWQKIEKETPEKASSSRTEAGTDETNKAEGAHTRATSKSKKPAIQTDVPAAQPIFEPAETRPIVADSYRSPLRYTEKGRRRGRYRSAALVGFIELILAVIGIIALASLGIRAIQKANDDTELRAELEDFLTPIVQYNPSAFTDVNETQQDSLLLAAVWRITEAERIRQLQENSSVSKYEMDDLGRMLISVKEVEESYAFLFGTTAKPYHHTIGDKGMSFTVEYDEEAGLYHIPTFSSSSIYVAVTDKLTKKGDTVTVRIGYVLYSKIGYDSKGNKIDPTAKQAEYFQYYKVQRVGESGWKLLSVTDEEGTTTTTIHYGDESDTGESEEQSKTTSQAAKGPTTTKAAAATASTTKR